MIELQMFNLAVQPHLHKADVGSSAYFYFQELNNMQRQITEKEIQKAQEHYLMQSKPFIDRLNEIHKWLTPKIVKTETEVKVFYEETEEIVMLRKHLDELYAQIKADLENGKFW